MNSYKKTFKKILSLILILSVTVCSSIVLSLNSNAASSSDINHLQDELTDLQKEQSDLKKQIAALQNDISNAEALKGKYEEQIENSKLEIDNYNTQLTIINQEILDTQADLEASEAKLKEKKDKFKERVRAMYMTGDTSMLGILVSADDFADYLYKAELLRCVSKQDNKLLNELKDEVTRINGQKKSLENKKNKINTLTSKLTTKQAELSAQIKELDALMSKLSNQKSDLQNQYNENTDDLKKLEQKIAEATKNTEGIVYSGSQFIWPVPGYYKVSSYFRTPTRPNHTGIDISSSGIYGKNIVAAADGVVTLSEYYYGYGNCVMINHGSKDGKTYVTLYGHASELCVSKGKYVKAGTVIAKVGSTGNSTGPHLHFEIRVNNVAQNPMNYFSN